MIRKDLHSDWLKMETHNERFRRKQREKSEERMFMMIDPLPNDPLPKRKLTIGIVGGIGSGKSTVSQMLDEYHSVAVIDADKLVRELFETEDTKIFLTRRFSNSILKENGGVHGFSIDRKALGKIVFNDKTKLKTLENYIHPKVDARRRELTEQYSKDDSIRIIVLDIPLLYETGLDTACDKVIYIDSTLEERIERVAKRGWHRKEIELREKNQLSCPEKHSRADFTIANYGDLDFLKTELDLVMSRISPNLAADETKHRLDEVWRDYHKPSGRDPARIPKVLKKIEEIWTKYPDLRLCQLIGNCWPAGDNYGKEDDTLIERLEVVYGQSKGSESEQK